MPLRSSQHHKTAMVVDATRYSNSRSSHTKPVSGVGSSAFEGMITQVGDAKYQYGRISRMGTGEDE
jgi:hypothetical protein